MERCIPITRQTRWRSPLFIKISSISQMMEDGMCRLVATLPQLDEQRCPDMFRCTDEVSYWLHENEERKQQIAALKETISELQEELRNHRHRIKVLELQVRPHGDWADPGNNPANRFGRLHQPRWRSPGYYDDVTSSSSSRHVTELSRCILLLFAPLWRQI